MLDTFDERDFHAIQLCREALALGKKAAWMSAQYKHESEKMRSGQMSSRDRSVSSVAVDKAVKVAKDTRA